MTSLTEMLERPSVSPFRAGHAPHTELQSGGISNDGDVTNTAHVYFYIRIFKRLNDIRIDVERA